MADETKESFFVIKVTHPKNGEMGYVEWDGKVVRVAPVVVGNMAQFDTSSQAQQFIHDHNLDTMVGNFQIKSNLDLIKEGAPGAVPANGPIFILQNKAGWKLFYDTVKHRYYWDNKPAGYCCWPDRASALVSLPNFQKKWKTMTITVEESNPKDKL